jgi:protein-L-isoaspartate(D-aspartate) O-methyltransferase
MLGKRVLTLDIDPVSQQTAAIIFENKRLDNIELEQLDVFKCQYDQAFNAIAVTGSVSSTPENLKTALRVGGRLFVIVGESPAMQALLITRASTSEWITESLFETDLPALII